MLPSKIVNPKVLATALKGLNPVVVASLEGAFNTKYQDDIPMDIDECFEVFVEDKLAPFRVGTLVDNNTLDYFRSLPNPIEVLEQMQSILISNIDSGTTEYTPFQQEAFNKITDVIEELNNEPRKPI